MRFKAQGKTGAGQEKKEMKEEGGRGKKKLTERSARKSRTKKNENLLSVEGGGSGKSIQRFFFPKPISGAPAPAPPFFSSLYSFERNEMKRSD